MKINFQTFGTGSPLIIMHGLFGTLDNLKQIAKALSEHHCVYLIDLPGHGESDTPTPFTLSEMANAVIDFAKQQELDEFALLGHSLGGKVAMEVALLEPNLVSKVIVADIAPVQYERRHDKIIQGLKAIDLVSTENRQAADKTLANYVTELGVRAFLLKSLRRSEISNQNWQWQFDLNALSENYDNLIDANSLSVYSGPVLFILGGNSEYVRPDHKAEIGKRFKNAKAKVIQNAGHWLHAEKPAAFEKICTDFLSNS